SVPACHDIHRGLDLTARGCVAGWNGQILLFRGPLCSIRARVGARVIEVVPARPERIQVKECRTRRFSRLATRPTISLSFVAELLAWSIPARTDERYPVLVDQDRL